MEIQDFLIASLQNILVLANHSHAKISKSNAQAGQYIHTKGVGFSIKSFVLSRVSRVILFFSGKREAFLFTMCCNRIFV